MLSILFVPPSRRSLFILFILPILSILFVPTSFTPAASAASSPSVTLAPSVASPQPVGATITWTAGATDFVLPLFRWRVGRVDGPLRTVKAFYTSETYKWTPIEEGTYQIEVVARERLWPETRVVATATFEVVSRVAGSQAVVSLAGHPLVALYSAPPCRPEESGEPPGVVTVEYRRVGTRVSQWTDGRPCVTGRSASFYVAGMYQSSLYGFRHVVTTPGGGRRSGPWLLMSAGTIPTGALAPSMLLDPPGPAASAAERLVLLAPSGVLADRGGSYAADLAGRPVWYYDTVGKQQLAAYITRFLPGGTALMIVGDGSRAGQILREIDLAGNSLRATNVLWLNEELAARGLDRITAIHHEATRLPNGQTLVLGAAERLYTDVHGYAGPVDVLGDVVIALDDDWQVLWAWSAFDHLDVQRGPAWPKLCVPQEGGCPPFYLAPEASDWLHSNSIGYSPPDGNIIVSLRMQDWVIKIDYRDGTGDGTVLWRLGRDGDFALADPTGDPYPWFSGQHDARYSGEREIVLYDNGNTRCLGAGPECHSRGQAYELDEASRTARLLLNADLGAFSLAWGAAQRLANGNYHFDSGIVQQPLNHAQSLEVLPDGRVDSVLQTLYGLYRSYRLRSLYAP